MTKDTCQFPQLIQSQVRILPCLYCNMQLYKPPASAIELISYWSRFMRL